jgi:hypothetical protein
MKVLNPSKINTVPAAITSSPSGRRLPPAMSSVTPEGPKKRRGPRPKELIPIQRISVEEINNPMIFGAKRLYEHLQLYSKEYGVSTSFPRDAEGRRAALVTLVQELKSRFSSCNEPESQV